MKTAYEKLQEIVTSGEGLLEEDITNSSPKFTAWKMKAERFLINQFGEKSHEFIEFGKIHFGLIYSFTATHVDWVNACHEGINTAIAVLNVILEDLSDNISKTTDALPVFNCKKVFIVHGHDGELKQSVARIIEKQGIEAVILSEQANQGKTIIEKFENYSDVGGAICLFTADDFGRSKKTDTDRARARQNVVFETGYFIGKLGRDHIVILADDGIEMPSDLSSVVHTNTGNWQVDMLKDLKAIGYEVDFNLLF